MKRRFAARVWRECGWYAASQGETEEEALELHFEPPQATRPPLVRTIEVEVANCGTVAESVDL